MKNLMKTMTGVAAAALVTLTAAAPAQAQYYPYPDDRQTGVNVGEIVRGVAVAGAAAAAIGAITNAVRGGVYGGYGNNGTYNRGYDNRGYGNYGYGYGNQGYGEQPAVDACAYQARRYGPQVAVTDVDRRGSSSYRVRGIIEASQDNGYNRGYQRLDNYRERRTFSCTARQDGRITDFDTNRYRG